eukprot:gb/GECG01014726.1/.p1 GENE.gb/GECG01014726.1/~~gb/GECG01014726.1/.p1  ORF type:complete len:474 (+),score=38.48 gb/GECG01014726.1/:1-1422(+)
MECPAMARETLPPRFLPTQYRLSPLNLVLPLTWILVSIGLSVTTLGTDIREQEECVEVDAEDPLLLKLVCNIKWGDRGYKGTHYMKLKANEIFDGQNFTIDLTDNMEVHGLFMVDDAVQSFTEAPLITHVHTTGGITVRKGGFILRKQQRFFKVHHCSSTGQVENAGGGIAGLHSGYTGEAAITNSYSTGSIGSSGGGIVGRGAGKSGGVMRISNCRTTGVIGSHAGGICGLQTGARRNSQVHITRCLTTGNIGPDAGGIAGASGAWASGRLDISQCATTGQISRNAGGIIGSYAGPTGGLVTIANSYTTGNLGCNTGSERSGAICGAQSGASGGSITIENVYTLASGRRRALIGSIASGEKAADAVEVRYSVYNATAGHTNSTYLVGEDKDSILWEKHNSGDLDAIRGKLYSVMTDKGEAHQWSNSTWFVPGSDQYPELQWLKVIPSHLPPSSPTLERYLSLSVQFPQRVIR